ncbi:MAG TPA: CHAT domain-containing protein, partial [Hyalangium sp.]|nr:CHAT domain-containing protein [Hyalangium sp.]
YQDRPFIPKPGRPADESGNSLRYLALILFPDGRIRAVDLGLAAAIDLAALRLHQAFAGNAVSHLPAAQTLYRRAFQPLLQHLGKSRQLFLAPDGQLNLVPFAALHDGHRFLVDTFDITYLTSGKELLPRPETPSPAHSVVVLADPDFGAPPAAPALMEQAPSALAERSASLKDFFSTLRTPGLDVPWPPLPGTRQEAQAIQHLFPQAQVLVGVEATKQALLKLSAPGLLHIATHGFFLEDAPQMPDVRAADSFGAVAARPKARPEDPLLRSGLVLAGAQPQEVPLGAHRPEDSLVTALELAGLNLWGTQLVVLSACDTGRGEVKRGEGVYGLRRALLVAGAETVVTSLWKVNDDVTRQLMEGYYRHLLAGHGRTRALREAMRQLRRKHPHPHYWAAFTALGSDAPLQIQEGPGKAGD